MIKLFCYEGINYARVLLQDMFLAQSISVKKIVWLDLNLGPLMLEVTALPTVPNHCPKYEFIYTISNIRNLSCPSIIDNVYS